VPEVREQRILVHSPSVLSRYLPEHIVDQLLEAGAAATADIDLGFHVARLQDLLQRIETYVPEYVGADLGRLHVPHPGYASRTHGTLLAADLSGFTAFSAQLGTLGSEGAELVARTINALFSALLGTLADWDGNLLKLSGDALTALFSGPDHAHRAVTAALELQQRMDAFQSIDTPAGVFALRIRIGLAGGDVFLAEVGSPERVELLVGGATARQVIELQRRAMPGAVVVGDSTYQQIAPICQAVTLAAGLYRILSLETSPASRQPEAYIWRARQNPAWELHALIGRIEALRPYLIHQYVDRLADGPPALAGEGDLRPVTVLFACLSDASALLQRAASGQHDPALIQLQSAAQRLWAIVDQHGGAINKIDLHPTGHTLIVLFGAPVAQGRDAERAVSCALALLQELGIHQRGAAEESAGGAPEPLMVRRVGLATGHVFAGAVGSPTRREYTVMGSVVNLAARLMDVAADGQALLDVATAQAAGRLARLQAQPPVLVKGYDQPVPCYRVAVQQRPRVSPFVRPESPLVGRAAELAQARQAVARALSGHGSVVALVGEAGIGKSRLLAEVARLSLGALPAGAIAAAQAQPHGRVQPYSIIAELFRQLYSLPEQTDMAARALAAHAQQLAPEQQRFASLLPTIFGLPPDPSPLTQALAPDERRARLQRLAVTLLAARAHAGPLALVIEDLHWADTASIDVLGAVAAAAPAEPLLLLCTYRPAPALSWPQDARLTQIELPPLTTEQSQALISAWMSPLTLSHALRSAVVDRTQGNPFFIEETTRALRERDLASDVEPPLPVTIQGALLARLDTLPLEERYVLQVASTIGPLFQRSLLADIAGEQVALDRALGQLSAAGLLRSDTEDSYAFAHSLTHETVYESLLFAQRRDLHHQIAERLRAAAQAGSDAALLAYHYRRAEDWPDVLEYAWKAGLHAQAIYASDIALGHYRQALEAASRLDQAAQQQQPAILRRIGDLHALAGRYTDAVAAYEDALAASAKTHEQADILICWADVCEQQAIYDAALELLDRAAALLPLDDNHLALRVAVRRGWVLIRQGAADRASMAVESVLEPLEQWQRWEDLLLAYKVYFHIALSQSRWSEARSYLRLALACAEKAGDMREIARVQNNIGIVLTQEGDLGAAAGECERAALTMRDIGDRNTLASIEVNIGAIYYKLGEFAVALEHYGESLRIALEINAPPIESVVRGNLGEIYRRLGRLQESLDQLTQSAELCRQTNDELGLAEAYRQLAETYIALDQLAEAERAADQACAVAIVSADPQAEAIAYRVRGMLAAKRGDYETALEDARRSIRMLAQIGSTHELGQSMVLQATILLHAGSNDAACDVLAEAIRLLSRVGAAADMKQAKELIDQARAQTQELHS
jgi:class 3 adenylate cyclase/tetratricopeptide (TPR) repeat protein